MKNDLLNIVVVKRSGEAVNFNPSKIAVAITKAYAEVFGMEASASLKDMASTITDAVVATVLNRGHASITIEQIQDMVELALMRDGQFEVAKSYILFRSRRAVARSPAMQEPEINMISGESTTELTDALVIQILTPHATGLAVDLAKVAQQTKRDLFNNCSQADLQRALNGAARAFVEVDPDYSRLAARLTIADLYLEVLPSASTASPEDLLKAAFFYGIQEGINTGLLNPEMAKFDLVLLASHLKRERDEQFDLLGIHTLYDRYFLHVEKRRIEVPQGFFMRVAMGLALNESDFNSRAIEFYNLMSAFDFMSSTPTLFNSGTRFSQLSSCYLTTIADDLGAIYDGIRENALLQKFAGGLGNDWTNVRALGSRIKGTNGESQGVVPFLKVVNDTAVAVNQGGKRKGAVCAYLETWHMDIEEFLDLRKNTGDDRRRTHDMNTANWVPDLFMRRVMEKGTWTLFSPNNVPDLHDLYGSAFEVAYNKHETSTINGVIKHFKTVQATDLWRKMLTMLFETGHPWITFKDPCNIRSPQQHVGVVHSSNLCTEITLNTSETETAVCNLGSVNLQQHIKEGRLDHEKLQATIKTAMRMLDNVIELNYYSVEKARQSNMRHRPVGMGIMGFQDALFELAVPYASDEAAVLADQWMEAVCYYAYSASADLAIERGSYESFEGSLWSKGVMPLDTIATLELERNWPINVDRSSTLDWDSLRTRVKKGMRNSNCVAIAPTATIGNIVGVNASIEPLFGNLSAKSNLAGEFTMINPYLVRDLKKIGAWDTAMVVELKHFDGSVQSILRVPAKLKELYKTAFEVSPMALIACAARRQKWIDQAQSLNLYLKGASGKKLDEVYKAAWESGLKTTYYLRTVGATSAEKSTIQTSNLNAVSNQAAAAPKFCALDDQGCESCQ